MACGPAPAQLGGIDTAAFMTEKQIVNIKYITRSYKHKVSAVKVELRQTNAVKGS